MANSKVISFTPHDYIYRKNRFYYIYIFFYIYIQTTRAIPETLKIPEFEKIFSEIRIYPNIPEFRYFDRKFNNSPCIVLKIHTANIVATYW